MTTTEEHEGEAVLYATDSELVSVTAPFLRDGLAAGENVIVLAAPRHRELLAAAVGGDPRLMTRPPMPGWRRPVEALAEHRQLLEDNAKPGLRLVSEADYGTGPVDWSEWARYEAVAHRDRSAYGVRSLCLLRRGDAPAPVVEASERIHPAMWRGGVRRPCARLSAAENVRRDAYVRADPMEDAPPLLRLDDLTVGRLGELRHGLTAALDEAGLAPWRAYELVLAVGEVAANAVAHGRPPVTVRLWLRPERVLCTVSDLGSGFDLPLDSYLLPDPDRAGFGLFLARQVCDQLNVCWTPAGFTVRLALIRP